MIALLNHLFERPPDAPETRCYAGLTAQARRAEFYRWWGVPDTLEGRFELLALHAFLILHRLKRQGEEARRFSRRLFEVMVADVDGLGPGPWLDESPAVPPVRALARGCNRRLHAYDSGLEAGADSAVSVGGGPLVIALSRNLYRTKAVPGPVTAGMAAYVGNSVTLLTKQPLERVLAGGVRFPEPPIPAWASAASWLAAYRIGQGGM